MRKNNRYLIQVVLVVELFQLLSLIPHTHSIQKNGQIIQGETPTLSTKRGVGRNRRYRANMSSETRLQNRLTREFMQQSKHQDSLSPKPINRITAADSPIIKRGTTSGLKKSQKMPLEEAILLLLDLQKEDPEEIAVMRTLAHLYFRSKKYQKSVVWVEKTWETADRYLANRKGYREYFSLHEAWALEMLWRNYSAMNGHVQALALARRGIALQQTIFHEGFYSKVAQSLVALERRSEALIFLIAVVGDSSDNESARFHNSKVLINQTANLFRVRREYDRALEMIERAIAIPGSGDNASETEKAVILRELGRIAEAVEQIQALVREDASNAHHHRFLAELFQQQGEFEQALRHIRVASSLAPSNRGHRSTQMAIIQGQRRHHKLGEML